MAVDATGCVPSSPRRRKQRRKISLVAGFCYRYNQGVREFMAQIHNGAIGDVRAIHTAYNTGGLWSKPRQPEWTDMEWQVRNWMYFTRSRRSHRGTGRA